MKLVKFYLVAMLAISLVSCISGDKGIATNPGTLNSPDALKNQPKGKPEFETTSHDFGVITDGDVVRYRFKFKNTGKGPLSINNVQASCGCTTPDWTHEVINPGEEGSITAQFNSDGKGPGVVDKYLEVSFIQSDVESLKLTFKADIKPKQK